MEAFAALAVLCGVITTVLWLLIGSRAMRAHERLADAASQWVQQQRAARVAPQPNPTPRAVSARHGQEG